VQIQTYLSPVLYTVMVFELCFLLICVLNFINFFAETKYMAPSGECLRGYGRVRLKNERLAPFVLAAYTPMLTRFFGHVGFNFGITYLLTYLLCARLNWLLVHIKSLHIIVIIIIIIMLAIILYYFLKTIFYVLMHHQRQNTLNCCRPILQWC